MGLKDIIKKSLMGATDEENRINREKMRTIFNQKVENGDAYTLIYCHSEGYTDAVMVKITRHSNYIVGYKGSGQSALVIIPVDATLSDADDAIMFTKENGAATSVSLGYCFVGNDSVGFRLEPITYSPGINRGSQYHLAVIQSQNEVSDFKSFCKSGFSE